RSWPSQFFQRTLLSTPSSKTGGENPRIGTKKNWSPREFDQTSINCNLCVHAGLGLDDRPSTVADGHRQYQPGDCIPPRLEQSATQSVVATLHRPASVPSRVYRH